MLGLRYAKILVDLQAQIPARMFETILQCERNVPVALRAVHGLEEETVEIQPDIEVRLCSFLRENKFQLVSGPENEVRPCFRAHAYPVDPWRRDPGAICFDGHFEASRMKCIDERGIELEQGFATGTDYQGVIRVSWTPGPSG